MRSASGVGLYGDRGAAALVFGYASPAGGSCSRSSDVVAGALRDGRPAARRPGLDPDLPWCAVNRRTFSVALEAGSERQRPSDNVGVEQGVSLLIAAAVRVWLVRHTRVPCPGTCRWRDGTCAYRPRPGSLLDADGPGAGLRVKQDLGLLACADEVHRAAREDEVVAANVVGIACAGWALRRSFLRR